VSSALARQVGASLRRETPDAVRAFAAHLAGPTGASAVLFYGSNLRTGALDGVLDFYVLHDGAPERGLWPRVSYHEWDWRGLTLRAKVAAMTLATFAAAARDRTLDTTVWARFVQPAALAWVRDDAAAAEVAAAVEGAVITAARFAVALGPDAGTPDDYWRALFRATYKAEFRVEKPGREASILAADPAHFRDLLPLALADAGIACPADNGRLRPRLGSPERARLLRRWCRLQRLGKPLNLIRLLRAAGTFAGAARYAAWKIERHTGVAVPLTPFRERHPVLAAPGVLWRVWRGRRQPA
jgi:hypothetical protein